MSLSSRRAWIEISEDELADGIGKSLSSRRAWIEITVRRSTVSKSMVALLTESVD